MKTTEIPHLGILGGGQLGRMFIQNAMRYNVRISVLDPDPKAPCADFAHTFQQGSFSDYDTVVQFGRTVDVLTIEIEHVNVQALYTLESEGIKVFPQARVLELIQHKGRQKQFYRDHQFPTSEFCFIEQRADIESLAPHWFPCFQKLFTSGYDGKGVQKLTSPADIDKAFDAPSVIEKAVDVEMELGVIVSGHIHGESAVFPGVDMIFHPVANLVEFLSAPSALPPEILQEAEKLAKALVAKLGIQGILAVEFFVDKDGRLLINEVAPRPHNSGHHTIQANVTSQYEQHLRAIMGWAPGNTETLMHAVMLNLLGEPGYDGLALYEGLEDALRIPGVQVQLYGKQYTKPFRKMGHVTVLASNPQLAMDRARIVQKTIKVVA